MLRDRFQDNVNLLADHIGLPVHQYWADFTPCAIGVIGDATYSKRRPDGHAALMLVSARLRHVSGTKWGTHKYMNMQLLNEMDLEAAYSAA